MASHFTVEWDEPPLSFRGPRVYWLGHYKIWERITKEGKFQRESLYFPVVPLRVQAQKAIDHHQHLKREMKDIKDHHIKRKKNGKLKIDKITGQYVFTSPMWEELYEICLKAEEELPVLTA